MERGSKEFAERMALCEKNASPDSEIDTSEIPPITEEMWARSMTREEAKAFRDARKNQAVTA
jgi:hypothetical protein